MSQDEGYLKKTSEAASNAGAAVAGAVSGSLSLNAGASQKKTTTTKTTMPPEQHQKIPNSANPGQAAQGRIADGGQQKKLTQQEADANYEERMEEEYAKREGGA